MIEPGFEEWISKQNYGALSSWVMDIAHNAYRAGKIDQQRAESLNEIEQAEEFERNDGC